MFTHNFYLYADVTPQAAGCSTRTVPRLILPYEMAAAAIFTELPLTGQ